MDRQKHLRFSPDERLLLDTLRQYLCVGSETEAAAQGLFVLGEQLLASYLMAGVHPQRCLVLLGVLGAAVREEEDQPRYQISDDGRHLLRWHPQSGQYLPVEPALAQWICPA